MPAMEPADVAGKRVVVMGLGRFGGGIGVTRWLAAQGAAVTVTDLDSAEKLAGSVAKIADLPVTLRLGGHDAADLESCDLLVVSPAVPKDRSAFVADARARSIPITSEMNLFIERCRARRVIGVTGSAGKSTTTAMLHGVLSAAADAGRLPTVWLGGNIGRSLLDDLPAIQPDHLVVLELSSFQLEDLAALRWSPPFAVITNLQPNHLDRHGTMDAYADAKLNVVRFQSSDGMIFIHQDQDDLAARVAEITTEARRHGEGGRMRSSSSPCLRASVVSPSGRQDGPRARIRRFAFDPAFADALRVPGPHNRDNAAAAIAVARALDLPDDVIAEGLSRFRGLPHRLELVGEHRGVRYYNDSKSTTPESARIALEAFDEPVVLLLGGRDKGMSFDGLARAVAERARGVICYGETGPKLASLIRDRNSPRRHGDTEKKESTGPRSMSPCSDASCKSAIRNPQSAMGEGAPSRAEGRAGGLIDVQCADSLIDAVKRASALAPPGSVVVLSPACTSYDAFANYEHRGDAFRAAVGNLPD